MLNFKHKTRQLHRWMYMTDPFHCYNKYIDEDDIDHIINVIFGEKLLVDNQGFLDELNSVVSKLGTTFPDINTRTPGKTDEVNLLTEIYKHNIKLQQALLILINQYGAETWQHIKMRSLYEEELNTEETLQNILLHCLILDRALPDATEDVKELDGKPTGNNTKQAVSELIKELIRIYEATTGHIAKCNIHQDRSSGTLQFKGQFYDFVHFIFWTINEKYDQFLPNNLEENPFAFCVPKRNPFKIGLNEPLIALGRQIESTLKQINKV